MAENIIINGTTYNNVDTISTQRVGGGSAVFKLAEDDGSKKYKVASTINSDYTQNLNILDTEVASVILPDNIDYIVSAEYVNYGETVEFNGNSYTIGTNAFATVQDAILNITEDGKVIYIASGTYEFVEPIDINYGITFLGANAGISGELSTRNAETIILNALEGATGILNINAQSITFNGIDFESSGLNVAQFFFELKNFGNFTIQNCKICTNDSGCNSFVKHRTEAYSVGEVKFKNNYFKNVLQFILWIRDASGLTNVEIENNTIENCFGVGVNGLFSIRDTSTNYTYKVCNNKFIFKEPFYSETSTFYVVKQYGGNTEIKYNSFAFSSNAYNNLFTGGIMLFQAGTYDYSNNLFYMIDGNVSDILTDYKGADVCETEETRVARYLVDASFASHYKYSDIDITKQARVVSYNGKPLSIKSDIVPKYMHTVTIRYFDSSSYMFLRFGLLTEDTEAYSAPAVVANKIQEAGYTSRYNQLQISGWYSSQGATEFSPVSSKIYQTYYNGAIWMVNGIENDSEQSFGMNVPTMYSDSYTILVEDIVTQ